MIQPGSCPRQNLSSLRCSLIKQPAYLLSSTTIQNYTTKIVFNDIFPFFFFRFFLFRAMEVAVRGCKIPLSGLKAMSGLVFRRVFASLLLTKTNSLLHCHGEFVDQYII